MSSNQSDVCWIFVVSVRQLCTMTFVLDKYVNPNCPAIPHYDGLKNQANDNNKCEGGGP